MFRFFKNSKNTCPIPEETRIWLENSFIWLINQFGEPILLSERTLTPTKNDFPIEFNGSEQMANEILKLVARQMKIESGAIQVNFFNQSPFELNTGFGRTLISQPYEDENNASGYYLGKNNDKFCISLEISQLKLPEKLIATISHELAHIKLVGKEKLAQTDEDLTDLMTVFFGLGIFTANAAFQFFSSQTKWGYSKQGYLIQQEWGYALALYAYIRNEFTPKWIEYLTKNIQSDFRKSMAYILRNKNKVLV